ncbi:MAG TPA: hypothetical protein VHE79_07930 [Spirochaetia bacterium]
MADRGDFEPFSDELSSDKIYCANCIHCKLIRIPRGGGGEYGLRVRCDAGKWRKKLGEEKVYKYFTVIRRTLDQCDSYEPMGEVEVFLKELRRSLPIKDETYSV